MLSVDCKPCEYARCKVDSGADLLSLRDSEHAEVLVFMLVLLLRVSGVRPRCDFFVADVDELGSYDCVKGLTPHIVVDGEATLIHDGRRGCYSDKTGGELVCMDEYESKTVYQQEGELNCLSAYRHDTRLL